ncbi:TonB-dependent siderophore receptor [Rapidithrix thailandica]|uniref:TonB-dependent siderophore receptor n=1 Tax=Rapidithrix thailandica TaxID=413964 RepID=A0AAW9SAI3_9BACT
MFNKILLFILLMVSSMAWAQNTETVKKDTVSDSHLLLEEVVITVQKKTYNTDQTSSSLRLEEHIKEVPQNVQVLNENVISDQQLYTMADAIARNVSGANRIEEWGDLYTYITMRGSRAGSLRNGMNTTLKYGLLSEDMSFVDRIEFVKGPAGFLFSGGEPSGMYNIVTKRPSGYNKGSVSLSLGSYGLYRASLDVDGIVNKDQSLLYRVNLSAQDGHSFREYETSKRFNIAPVIQYQFDEKTTLTLEYILQYAQLPDLGISNLFSKTGYGTVAKTRTISDPGIEPSVIKDQNMTVNLEHKLSDNWKLTTQLSYFDYDLKGSFLWIQNIDNEGYLQRIRYIWDAKNEMTFGQAYINGSFSTGIVKHKLLGGLDYNAKSYVADFSQSHILDSVGTFNIHSDQYQKPYFGVGQFDRSIDTKERVGAGFLLEENLMSVYLQDRLSFLKEKLHITLAGRYTYLKNNNYGTVSENKKITPRFGLNYAVTDRTNLYALYDQSFVPQTGRLRHGGEIKPLTGNNVEFGIKKDWRNRKWNTTLSLYRITKNNQVSNDPDNIGGENYVLQFGQTRTQGVEFDIKGELLTGLNALANYAFTESVITKSTTQFEKGTFVPGYTKHTINTWLNYRIQKGSLKKISVSAGMMYMLDRRTWWNGDFKGEDLPDYFRLDAAVSWNSQKTRIALNVYNVLNKDLYNGGHHSSGWYYWRPESPRNIRLNLTYNF